MEVKKTWNINRYSVKRELNSILGALENPYYNFVGMIIRFAYIMCNCFSVEQNPRPRRSSQSPTNSGANARKQPESNGPQTHISNASMVSNVRFLYVLTQRLFTQQMSLLFNVNITASFIK